VEAQNGALPSLVFNTYLSLPYAPKLHHKMAILAGMAPAAGSARGTSTSNSTGAGGSTSRGNEHSPLSPPRDAPSSGSADCKSGRMASPNHPTRLPPACHARCCRRTMEVQWTTSPGWSRPATIPLGISAAPFRSRSSRRGRSRSRSSRSRRDDRCYNDPCKVPAYAEQDSYSGTYMYTHPVGRAE
jgi:hypothetical protein